MTELGQNLPVFINFVDLFDHFSRFEYTLFVHFFSNMKDLFAEFKKATLKQHLAIGTAAFAFALGVNYLLFATDTGVKLQASAIEATGTTKKQAGPDFVVSMSPGTDRLSVQVSRAVSGVKSLEFTLLGDPTALSIEGAQMAGGASDDTPLYKGEIVRSASVPGVALYRVIFASPTTIAAGSTVVTIALTRKGAGATPVNVAGVRVMTTDGAYELSSQGAQIK